METGTARISSGEPNRTNGDDQQGPQRYRGSAGVEDIIRIIGATLHVSQVHWVDHLNRGFACSRTMDKGDGVFRGPCPICETGNRPKERFHAKVLHLVRGADDVGEYRLWSFGLGPYKQLGRIAAAVGDITCVDLILKCVDEKYQKFDISAAEGRLATEPDPARDFEVGPIVEEPTCDELRAQYTEAVVAA